jgi:hypothetical protein
MQNRRRNTIAKSNRHQRVQHGGYIGVELRQIGKNAAITRVATRNGMAAWRWRIGAIALA